MCKQPTVLGSLISKQMLFLEAIYHISFYGSTINRQDGHMDPRTAAYLGGGGTFLELLLGDI